MESKKEEALKVLKTAERYFLERNFVVARQHALDAQSLYPGLHGVTQMLASLNVYLASEARVNKEIDYYSILGVKPTADDKRVSNQFNRLTTLLQRNKNKVVGSDGALKLVSEAWSVLSDQAKRSAYDIRRNKKLPSQNNLTNSSSFHGNSAAHFDYSQTVPVPHHRLDTFWTVCTSCKVQYEYLRKYLNKKLSCKNCRGVFLAVETGATPINGAHTFNTWSSMSTNGSAGNNANGVSYYPSNSMVYNGNRVHFGHGSEHSLNLSFQRSSISNGHVKVKSNEKRKLEDEDKGYINTCSVQISSNAPIPYRNPLFTKSGKIDKRRRVDTSADLQSLYKDTFSNTPSEVRLSYANTNITVDHVSFPSDVRRLVVAPQLDIRNMLLDKAKKEIKRKLEEFTLADAADKNVTKCDDNIKPIEDERKSELISINVPDPDFHDFDMDRSEQCFKAKQIWALYDEEGMPRLYCMIREVISLEPFSMHITYLSSKTSNEFGSVDWVTAGFTKSCGNFKTMHSETVDQVNIFSHVLSDDIKAGRGGRVRIYPRSGDVWAVYRNWSPDWDSYTPDDVKRLYDMVEVINDYTEEFGVHIFPLVKLEGYNTVYRRPADETTIQWIPREEMFRFSHQVPSWRLEGSAYGLPDGCWDLDPAATPDDLLHSTQHVTNEPKTNIGLKKLEEPMELNHYSKVKLDEPLDMNKYNVAEPQPNLEDKLHEFSFSDLKKVEILRSTGDQHTITEGEAYPDLEDQHSIKPELALELNKYSYASEKISHTPEIQDHDYEVINDA